MSQRFLLYTCVTTNTWHPCTTSPAYLSHLSRPSVADTRFPLCKMWVGRRRKLLCTPLHHYKWCFIIVRNLLCAGKWKSLRKFNHFHCTHLSLNLGLLKTMRTIWNGNESVGFFFYITALGKCNNLVISETKKASENLHPFPLVHFLQRVGNEFLRELTIN